MDATEICPLTLDSITQLLQGRQQQAEGLKQHERRLAPRWPFPSPVELWISNPAGDESYMLATCENLSTGGMGVRCDDSLPVGTEYNIAIHQPEVSLHGKAIVRHTTKMTGEYYVGMEFLFDK